MADRKPEPVRMILWPCPDCYTEWDYPACENCQTEIPRAAGYWWPTGEPIAEGE